MKQRADYIAMVTALLIAVFMMAHCAKVYSTCDGIVVKNGFDWPVCIEARP